MPQIMQLQEAKKTTHDHLMQQILNKDAKRHSQNNLMRVPDMTSRNSQYSGQTSSRISPGRHVTYASRANLEEADKSETFQSIMEFEQKLDKNVQITSSQYQVKPSQSFDHTGNVTSEINEAAGSSEVLRNNGE